MSELPKPPIAAALLLSAVLGGCDGYESAERREAIMSIINDGGVSNCPVDLACARDRNFNTGLHACIDVTRCDPPIEE